MKAGGIASARTSADPDRKTEILLVAGDSGDNNGSIAGGSISRVVGPLCNGWSPMFLHDLMHPNWELNQIARLIELRDIFLQV